MDCCTCPCLPNHHSFWSTICFCFLKAATSNLGAHTWMQTLLPYAYTFETLTNVDIAKQWRQLAGCLVDLFGCLFAFLIWFDDVKAANHHQQNGIMSPVTYRILEHTNTKNLSIYYLLFILVFQKGRISNSLSAINLPFSPHQCRHTFLVLFCFR